MKSAVVWQKNYGSIKDWAEDDRPREKLLRKGKEVLSDAELIAILMGCGSKSESALDLARRILNKVGHNLNELSKLESDDLRTFHGIGEAKAVAIITALELGKRRRQSEVLQKRQILNSTDAYNVLQPLMEDLRHEEFWVIYLSNHNRIIQHKCMSKGGLTGTLADIRLIFREALTNHSTALILAHNHPSGNKNPSATDKSMTRKLRETGEVMDIKVLDHLIVTEQQYFSFADEGLM